MKTMLPALLKLLLVLAAVSHGTATFCDITETKTLVQCYGALGQSVFINPSRTTFEISDLKVFFEDKEFFRYNPKRTPNGTCQNRCEFTTNGTLRLDHVMESDSGIYTFEEYDKEGKSRQKRNISLTIEDPVSPPALSQLCLSHGDIRVNCSSTGDNPQYNWALDNRTLDGGVAFFSDETQTLILRRNVSGSITCTASNRVSSEHTTQELQKCPGSAALSPHSPTNGPALLPTEEGSLWNIVLPTVLGVCLLLMVLLLGTCYLYKKRQKQTKTSQRSVGDRCEDPQELVYSQVQVVKKKQRPKKQEQEPQVVYGEVKVSDASKAFRHSPNE